MEEEVKLLKKRIAELEAQVRHLRARLDAERPAPPVQDAVPNPYAVR